jgi:predicted hydrolase (HD superfamily)
VRLYIRMADASLEQIGYTEHGERHVTLVSHIAYNVLKRMGRPERMCELAGIAGMLHDIGNAVNRDHHAQTGAVMAMQLLREFGMADEELLTVIAAIGNHHENDGDPVNDVAAALILAGQVGCAPHARAQSRDDQVRHPRPRELRRGEEFPERRRGSASTSRSSSRSTPRRRT